MTADTVGWIALGCAGFVLGYVLGYMAGRDGAERLAHATIADLRAVIHGLQRDLDVLRDHIGRSRYLAADEARPE